MHLWPISLSSVSWTAGAKPGWEWLHLMKLRSLPFVVGSPVFSLCVILFREIINICRRECSGGGGDCAVVYNQGKLESGWCDFATFIPKISFRVLTRSRKNQKYSSSFRILLCWPGLQHLPRLPDIPRL